MRKLIVAILALVAIVFIYLLLAVNAERKELQEYKKQIELDSISYHKQRTEDSIKTPN